MVEETPSLDAALVLAGRTWWNVNSTAQGGGVAEMLRVILPYVRGAGIETRWLVIEGSPEFFRVTKRVHHALHGSAGEGTPLGPDERETYEAVLRGNAAELQALVKPGDVVLLHDPQTAGLVPPLAAAGATVIWRCHVGADVANGEVGHGWAFLAPYLDDAAATVFSRDAYIPEGFDRDRTAVIAPSIDAFDPKNQELAPAAMRAILVQAGLVAGPAGDGEPTFRREDGSAGRVTREASVVRHGAAPSWETPLVVQVSRWDPLKDPAGVLRGFVAMVEETPSLDAALVLAGPDVTAVADDPEGADVFAELVALWERLPEASRARVYLANLPMADVDENAAIVNALQRHAAVVVQKSLREGFGLTVTEAMWKGRPVVASAVGGIQDQIVDGEHGLLLADPTDLAAYGAAVRRLLTNRAEAKRLGDAGHRRVREQYLGVRHLMQYVDLLERLDRRAG
jgi:trehalose synthase